MKLEEIFTADELALIDSGEYKPGRPVLDAKLDLVAAIEREACAAMLEDWSKHAWNPWDCAAAIRARGEE